MGELERQLISVTTHCSQELSKKAGEKSIFLFQFAPLPFCHPGRILVANGNDARVNAFLVRLQGPFRMTAGKDDIMEEKLNKEETRKRSRHL
ncbi:hypothetical protein TH63_16790 [Rufibacter radiotolerans]|uniref:Uncharacterized protein n=1 Tax=Rufibacter radiotolerans TaxID=1379910 RepID=A0A0H4VSZ7_9BACT|nr:hypothetical protein TH63_16790 [Rufibacter radiotolerans]